MTTAQPTLHPVQLLTLPLRHPRYWIVPTLAVACLAAVYAFVRPLRWEAAQALIVRNEAASNPGQPGKFSQPEEMKAVQETILELARSRGVLLAALSEVGPPTGYRGAAAAWPTEEALEDLRDELKLSPPKGAEFGKTEIFYLQVRDKEQHRAVALAEAITGQLERRYQELRDSRAQSMIGELDKAADVARRDLAESTARLKTVEQQVGSELAELRTLEDASTGESALRRTLTEIRTELRTAQSARQTSEQLLTVLKGAEQDPAALIATPAALLESQPALKKLREGLVDAQLKSADLEGRMSAAHPLVQAARGAEQEIRQRLHGEVTTAIRNTAIDLELSGKRLAMLEGQLAEVTDKLDQLAGLRAEYANLVAETRNRSNLLERADQTLAEARFSQATARAASLIGRIDAPITGDRPVGPSRSTIVLAGLIGGLLAGLGLLVLVAEPQVVTTATQPVVGANGRAGLPAPAVFARSRVFGTGRC